MKRLLAAWKRRPVITSAFILAVLFTCMFAFRSVAMLIYWSHPDHQNQAIQAWMTPRYVAQSWQLPPDVMYRALGTDEMPGRRIMLGEIAKQQGISMDELAARIAAAAATFRGAEN